MQVNQEDRIAQQGKSEGSSSFTMVAIAVVALIAGGAYYFISSPTEAPIEEVVLEIAEPAAGSVVVLTPEIAPVIPAEPEIEIIEQIEPLVQVEPLPTLASSDSFVHTKALAMTQDKSIEALLVDKDLIRHFVVFVDNLAQGELARQVSPIKAPEQEFSVIEITNKTYLNPIGYQRYDIYADFISLLDKQQLAATYKQLTPLFDEAFAELGYDNTSFNERMLEAIDTMLAAPIIDTPIELDGISVNYQLVDPELEALPDAQKLMIRMGPLNSKKIKAALRELRKQLVN